MHLAFRADARLHRHTAPWWFLLCVGLILAVALLDYVTGHELSLAVLYLAPIFIAAWVVGRDTGVTASMIAAMTHLVTSLFMGVRYSHPFYYFWDASITFLTFALFAFIISRLKVALEHADERFVTVLEALDSAVFVTDASGELLYANEQFHRSAGGGAAFLDAVREANAGGASGPGADLAHSAGREGEFHDAAHRRWYLIRSRATTWVDGRTVQLHRATDITDRKQAAEISRQQQEKLQMTSRLVTIGEMASTLAHEMNQPLAAIANYTMGCVRRLRSGSWDAAELLAVLEKTGAQAERAGKIIQRVRSFVSKREPTFAACDLNETIRGVVGLIEIEAERDAIALATDLAADLPAVRADPVMIEQIVLNLLKNGIEAMRDSPPDSRRLAIRSASSVPGMVEVTITDTGHGLPPDFERHFSSLFYTTKAQGMGLGLHICRSILEVHAGRLWVTSNAGGTSFHFSLPAAQP